MNCPINRLAFTAAAVAGLGLMVAAGPAAACDVTSSTDISCGGANSSPANPYNIANQPHPENNSSSPTIQSQPENDSSSPNFAAPGGRRDVFNPGGSLSGVYSQLGLCRFGDGDCPDPDHPFVHPRHHRLHRHTE